jgi:predicted molibdopterin-dependent oxidoreductase YjgC
MFRSLRKSGSSSVSVVINGAKINAPEGSSIWAAMALAGQTNTRLASVSKDQRSAYCAMGVCFECLVEIDGVPNQQACMTRVRDGMQIESQQLSEDSQASLMDEPTEASE